MAGELWFAPCVRVGSKGSTMSPVKLDPNTLPRAVALQYDKGEIVYSAGQQPVLREYSYNGLGLRTFGKSTNFATDPRFQRAYARSRVNDQTGRKKGLHIDDIRWQIHVALWAATQAA
jgi:hypothetical protein